MLSRVDLPGSGKSYKFGFNGKLNDNEVKGGLGNQQDYGMRISDPRIGRFLSVDPITKNYPELTPYQFASNRPVDGVDQDGLEWELSTANNRLKQYTTWLLTPKFNNGTISAYDPSRKSWTEKWRDSKNVVANITYDISNGLYTLPQQLTASVRNEDYITNIGGNVHRAHGIGDEKKRLNNFVNGATVFLPGSAATKAEGALARYTEGILVKIENQVTEQFTKTATQISVEEKLGKYLLNRQHPVGGSKAKWFEQALGFNEKNLDQLSKQIVFDSQKAVETAITEYGTKYNQVIPITGANGKTIDVLFSWIRNKDNIVRLVTAIPAKK